MNKKLILSIGTLGAVVAPVAAVVACGDEDVPTFTLKKDGSNVQDLMPWVEKLSKDVKKAEVIYDGKTYTLTKGGMPEELMKIVAGFSAPTTNS